ncbi:MAG: B12-binding domain-containing radical SAM protein [Deltaproteobacteria bacterium]|nr:MAG: B12-binding domain-containing radical SAM protein [Deltaproteobacteria bacterium]
MKVLLVYPEFPDTFWSFKHALKFIHKKAAQPPLGLLTVGAMLPKDWSVRLIDMNVTRLTAWDLQGVDYVFLSAMVVQKASALQVISKCKKAGVKVVAGGPLFTSEYDQFDEVDHLILNEAEITLPPFLRDLAAGCPQRIYTTSRFADITETPVPAWDLLDMKRYAAMSLQFSRGCPFNCEFCNVTTLFGHRPRIKSAEQVISELDAIYHQGWRGRVFFVDDNFIGNKKFLKNELLPALIEWRNGKKGVPLNTETSVNLADDASLMKMMVDAGFDTVFIGIETPDEGSLAECNKKQNRNRDLAQCVRTIQRAGLEVQAGFIVGFDHDTPSIFQRQVEFIQKTGIVTAMVGLLQAPLGTPLYERLKREGRLLGDMSGDTDGTTNIIPKMDPHLLKEGYRYIMSHLYSPRNYYKRVQTFLREYRKPKINVPIDFQYVLAFFRATIRLGIIGKERFQYWKMIFWTLFRKPSMFPMAVTFAIYGYHFRKVAKL